MITEERFIEIMADETYHKSEGDKVYQGMQIISKYTNSVIAGAEHDVIYSEEIDKLIAAGITEEEVMQLQKLSWWVEDGSYLAHYV